MKGLRLNRMLLAACVLAAGCASVAEMTDEDLEQRFENCKAAGINPGMLCAPLGRELARRGEAKRLLDKQTEERENARRQAASDAREIEISKTLRMPPAGMSDPAVERKMLEAYVESFPNEKLTPLRAVITSRSFVPIRHEISGIITARGFAGVIAMKRPNGECFVASTYYEQVYDIQSYTIVGFHRYSTPYPEESTKLQQLIECANVYQ